jgi:predicted Zn-dependent peptidase
MEIKPYPAVGETLYCETLPNGLRLRVIPKPGFRSRYAVLAVNYGGAHRRFSLGGEMIDTPAGVAHYLEHKLFDLPEGDDALDRLSANGADPNAFTAAAGTCYYFQCTEHFEENLALLLHLVCTPYFTEETVEKERGIIAQEIQMGEDSPGSAVYHWLLRQLYVHHPIRDKVIGTRESVAAIRAETLHACHRAFYAPGNLCLCVEGDVDPQTVARIAREALPPEAGELPAVDFGQEEPLLPREKLHREEMDVSAPQFLIGAKFRPAPAGDGALRQRLIAGLSLRMLLGASSAFYNRLYAQGLLNRDFDAEVDFSAGTATVLIGGESPDPEGVLRALEEELAGVEREGLDPLRFERAKRASIGARLRGLEDFESVCLAVAEGVFEGYCPLDAAEMLQSIRKEECEDFLCTALAPERFALSIIDPRRA